VLAHRTSFVILALFLFVSPAPAKDVAAIASVSWTPRQLESGSVCLFTVTPTADATALNGKWMGHNISFVKARDRNVWYALAGIDVEARPGSYPVEVRASWPDGSTVTVDRRVQVLTARYKTEKLRVPTNYVEPDAATLQIIAADRKIKEEAFARQSPRAAWSGDFLPPVKTTMSEAFGTRRTFNGKLASIHRGLDYHAKPGTPVLASNSGKVLLARGLFYEGNCVVIDHGQGFVTFYMHLSTIEVVEGQTVSKGELIGQSGATGRVTGPHLHMAARWEGAYVDPAKLFQLPLPTVP
jgi:hypothetical protein